MRGLKLDEMIQGGEWGRGKNYGEPRGDEEWGFHGFHVYVEKNFFYEVHVYTFKKIKKWC